MSEKGKIVFLHSSSELYGASKILIFVIEIVQKMGFPILVILPGEGPLAKEMMRLGFDVRIMNLGILRRKYFSPLGIINRGKRLVQAYQFLKDLHQQEKIALIYSNTLAVIIGAVFARRKKIPHVWHIHEILHSPEFLIKFLARQLDQTTPNPLVVSEAVANHWRKYLQIAIPSVIHNGMDYSPFLHAKSYLRQSLGVKNDQPVITMIGRINPGKGQQFFLQMAKELIQLYPNAVFWMVGDPYPGYEPIHGQLKEYIRTHHLEASVMDLGFRMDVPEVLASSDIFVLPSILPDSFPTVILEAMASGLPVVATDSGGASEMIEDEVTGYLIPMGDVKLGVSRIASLLKDRKAAKVMGLAGQQRVQELFSFQKFSTKIEQFLWQQIN
jgi:glycosyltransferase involved in cell wall biosynthesis